MGIYSHTHFNTKPEAACFTVMHDSRNESDYRAIYSFLFFFRKSILLISRFKSFDTLPTF